MSFFWGAAAAYPAGGP